MAGRLTRPPANARQLASHMLYLQRSTERTGRRRDAEACGRKAGRAMAARGKLSARHAPGRGLLALAACSLLLCLFAPGCAASTQGQQLAQAQSRALALGVAPPPPPIPPAPPPLPPAPLSYAAIGASDAFGIGTDSPQTESWPAVVAHRLSATSHLINLGIPGATVALA